MEVILEIQSGGVTDALERLSAKVEDLSTLMATLAEQLYTITDESFDANRSPDGTAWADLAPATWRHKQSGRMLYESGTLRDSLYSSSDAHTAMVGVNASSNGFQYGLSHQFGAPSRNIPARPFLPVYDDGTLMSSAEAELVQSVMAYFEIG